MKGTLTSTQISLLNALKASFHNSQIPQLSEDVLDEADKQAVLPLVSHDIRSKMIMIHNVQLLSQQHELNGLIILSHINQHMESGLGLRQIIDWIMYVNKCLPDSKWPAFRDKANQIGLTILAKAVARLCLLNDYRLVASQNAVFF